MTKQEQLEKMIDVFLSLKKAGLKEKQIMELMKLNWRSNG